MNMTPKQRNFLVLCGAILVVWYVGRSVISSMQQAEYRRQQALRAAQLRAQAKPPAPPSAPLVNPLLKFSPLTNLSNLSGFWGGQGLLAGQGLCTLHLELREMQDTPGNYTGYSTLGCTPAPALWGLKGGRLLPPNIRNNMGPKALILTGAPENGAIRFQVDKTVVGDPDSCATTSFTVTPFGTNKVAAQWREGPCQNAQILLDRLQR